MPKVRCGVVAVEALRAAGVTKVFGLMGSSTLYLIRASLIRGALEIAALRF